MYMQGCFMHVEDGFEWIPTSDERGRETRERQTKKVFLTDLEGSVRKMEILWYDIGVHLLYAFVGIARTVRINEIQEDLKA